VLLAPAFLPQGDPLLASYQRLLSSCAALEDAVASLGPSAPTADSEGEDLRAASATSRPPERPHAVRPGREQAAMAPGAAEGTSAAPAKVAGDPLSLCRESGRREGSAWGKCGRGASITWGRDQARDVLSSLGVDAQELAGQLALRRLLQERLRL
jgi:hypothetical protein